MNYIIASIHCTSQKIGQLGQWLIAQRNCEGVLSTLSGLGLITFCRAYTKWILNGYRSSEEYHLIAFVGVIMSLTGSSVYVYHKLNL